MHLRALESWREYVAAEALQQTVWQMPDWRDVVPASLLITAQANGGIVLGAFDADERLVGLVFSFLGVTQWRKETIAKHCSHVLAVHPDYQGQGIGARLKWKQRDLALAQGVPLITWTFEPLLALNAHLNLRRLGARARRYVVNAYGEMTDALNRGLPSDRLEAEWWLDDPRVRARAHAAPPAGDWEEWVGAGAQQVGHVEFDARGLPRLARIEPPRQNLLLVEIPADWHALRAAAPALASEWRAATRALFPQLFAAGYTATDFVWRRGELARAAYVLTRESVEGNATR